MVKQIPSQPAIERFGPWLTILAFAGAVLFMSIDVVLAIFRVLAGATFHQSLGIFILQVASVSLGGGAVGVGVGAIVLKSEWFTRSILRFLRYGIWLALIAAFVIVFPDNRNYGGGIICK